MHIDNFSFVSSPLSPEVQEELPVIVSSDESDDCMVTLIRFCFLNGHFVVI